MSYTGMMELIHALRVVTAEAMVWFGSFVKKILGFFSMGFLGIPK